MTSSAGLSAHVYSTRWGRDFPSYRLTLSGLHWPIMPQWSDPGTYSCCLKTMTILSGDFRCSPDEKVFHLTLTIFQSTDSCKNTTKWSDERGNKGGLLGWRNLPKIRCWHLLLKTDLFYALGGQSIILHLCQGLFTLETTPFSPMPFSSSLVFGWRWMVRLLGGEREKGCAPPVSTLYAISLHLP